MEDIQNQLIRLRNDVEDVGDSLNFWLQVKLEENIRNLTLIMVTIKIAITY